jgi:hypothetical protein
MLPAFGLHLQVLRCEVTVQALQVAACLGTIGNFS